MRCALAILAAFLTICAFAAAPKDKPKAKRVQVGVARVAPIVVLELEPVDTITNAPVVVPCIAEVEQIVVQAIEANNMEAVERIVVQAIGANSLDAVDVIIAKAIEVDSLDAVDVIIAKVIEVGSIEIVNRIITVAVEARRMDVVERIVVKAMGRFDYLDVGLPMSRVWALVLRGRDAEKRGDMELADRMYRKLEELLEKEMSK